MVYLGINIPLNVPHDWRDQAVVSRILHELASAVLQRSLHDDPIQISCFQIFFQLRQVILAHHILR